MSAADFILILLAAFFVLPVVAYMVMKFGTAGYLMAKRRDKKSNQNKTENEKE